MGPAPASRTTTNPFRYRSIDVRERDNKAEVDEADDDFSNVSIKLNE
jgi:hypothetical protein